MFIRKYKKIILILILFFLAALNARALDVVDGGNSGGTNNPCNVRKGKNDEVGYIACYSSKFQFRVTLVNENGVKVDKTKSVDFTYSKEGKTSDNKTEEKKAKLINKNYKYKYGENTNDDFRYVELKIKNENFDTYQKDGKDNPTYYSNFYNDLSTALGSRNPKDVCFDEACKKKGDLLSVMLYYTGYIENPAILEESGKITDFSSNNYYLLVEPTYDIYYNSRPNEQVKYTYGTASEITEFIYGEISNNNQKYQSGYLAGLTLNYIYQTACNMYTTDENGKKVNFSKITSDTDCGIYSTIDPAQTGSYLPKPERLTYIKDVYDQTTGYGVSVISLKELLKIEEEIVFNIDLCEKDDGKISVKPQVKVEDSVYSDIQSGSEYEKSFKNDIFKVTEGLYCYDEVYYNFSDTLSAFNNQTFKPLSTIEIPEGKVTINRYCYFDLESDALEFKAKDTSSYKNMIIKLNALDNIEMELNEKNISIQDRRENNVYGIKFGWVDYKIELTYNYRNNKENKYTLLNDTNIEEQNGYIDFSNYITSLFGYSDKVINKIIEEGKITITNIANTKDYIFSVNYTDGERSEDNLKCGFKYTVDDTDIYGADLQFRTISLSNPFPARDGTSRLPGSNWLNTENYVYDYINNNRAIQYKRKSTTDNPELMYLETEPMYTVTLDPATMMKIRQYNSQNTYDYINLACNKDNRECQSIFLRNTYYIPLNNLSGVCSDSSNFHKVVEPIDENIKESDIRTNLYGENPIYIARYDFNKNYRMDTEDLEIFTDEIIYNEEKNTGFYTCADKTYKSGG